MTNNLLNIDQNAKTIKGQKKGYMTGILYLAPANLSGYEVCPMRSAGCTAGCLNTAGRGVFSNVQKSRIEKTKQFFNNQTVFMDMLEKNIISLTKRASKNNLKPCVRLNGTSDISWENVGGEFKNLLNKFPHLQFYDYSKNNIRMERFLGGLMPKNYHLTFSLNENNMATALEILKLGGNVAMVFDTKTGKALPKTHLGFKVMDGDLSDLRFLDKQGIIVGLRAKGKARKDTQSGFVQTTVKAPLKLVA